MKNSKIKLVIASYLPSFNKGELAMLRGILQTFNRLGSTDVAIFTFYPELDSTRYPQEIRLIDIGKDLNVKRYLGGTDNSRFFASMYIFFQHILFAISYKVFGARVFNYMKSSIWREYYSSDALIVCTDEDNCVIGPGYFIRYSPVYISLLAGILKKPVVIYANGNTRSDNIVWIIWRFKSRYLWEILARYVLNKASLITVRDRETYAYYKSLLYCSNYLHFTGDPGILINPAPYNVVLNLLAKEKIEKDDGLLVGICITRRLILHSFSEYTIESERYEKGISEIAKAFDRLIGKYKTKFIFLPHVIGPTSFNDDRIVGYDIIARMKNKTHAKVIDTEYAEQEIKGLIGQLDFFIGDRIHGLINALSMNVPCCILAYRSDRRPYALIGKDFNQNNWIFEVEKLEGDALFHFICSLVDSSEKIRGILPQIIQGLKKRAVQNGDFLRKTLFPSKPNLE
jgi:polysaccharide pyruvyl transferase WcaK-like protein